MIALPQANRCWGEEGFADAFKQEVEQLPHKELPLQQGLSLSSYVSGEPFKVMLINSSADEGTIRIKAGVFYSGIIAGCSCSDDPTPTDVQAEYCDLEFIIDRSSGEASVKLLTGN